MRKSDEKTKWAFDTRPGDGEPNRPVYVGNRDDWAAHENRIRIWTKPLIEGATKAAHGTHWYQIGRYKCCHDLDRCGIRVSVAQGPIQEWNFRRSWSESGAHSKPRACINRKYYIGESRFHIMTKLHIARFLTHQKNRELYGIRSERDVKVEKDVGRFRPDVHYENIHGEIIAIEVEFTNNIENSRKKINREKHEFFGSEMVVIPIKKSILANRSDSEFSTWMQSGEVDDLLREELKPETRELRYRQREDFFVTAEAELQRQRMRDKESECQKRFKFDLDSFGRSVEDFSDEDDIEEAFRLEDDNRKLKKDLEETHWSLIQKYEEELPDVDLNSFISIEELEQHYDDHLGNDYRQRKERERAEWIQRNRGRVKEHIETKSKELMKTYGTDFGILNEVLDTLGDVNRFIAKQIDLKKQLDEIIANVEDTFGFKGLLVHQTEHSLEDLVNNETLVRELYSKEKELRSQIDVWYDELTSQFGFELDKIYSIERLYIEEKHQIEQRYQAEENRRENGMNLLTDYLAKYIDKQKQKYPHTDVLKDFDFEKYLTRINAAKYGFNNGIEHAFIPRTWPSIPEFEEEVTSILKGDECGMQNLENKLQTRIVDLRNFIQGASFWKNVISMENMKVMTYRDFIKGKYGGKHNRWDYWDGIKIYQNVAEKCIEELDNLESSLIGDSKRDTLIARIMDISGLGDDLKLIPDRMSPFPMLSLNIESLLHSTGTKEWGAHYIEEKYANPSLTATGLLHRFNHDRLELINVVLSDDETRREWHFLLSDVTNIVNGWNNFLTDISKAYYSPELEWKDGSCVFRKRFSCFELIDLITDEHIQDIHDESHPPKGRIPMEQQVALSVTRNRRDYIVREIENTEDLIKKMRKEFSYQSGKMRDIMKRSQEILKETHSLLIACDEISRREQENILKEHGVKFNSNRIQLYEIINSSEPLQNFPRIERKYNLSIDLNEDSSNYTVVQINRNLQEKTQGDLTTFRFIPEKMKLPKYDIASMRTVNRRRRKRGQEPFNPFAADASTTRRKMKIERNNELMPNKRFRYEESRFETINMCNSLLATAHGWDELLDFISSQDKLFLSELVSAVKDAHLRNFSKLFKGTKYSDECFSFWNRFEPIKNSDE